MDNDALISYLTAEFATSDLARRILALCSPEQRAALEAEATAWATRDPDEDEQVDN